MIRMRVVLLVAVLALMSFGAYGLSLCDYRAPMTSLTDAGLSFSYRYYDDGATTGVDVDSGRLKFDLDRVFDSPDIGYSFSGVAEVTLAQLLPVGWLGQGTGTFRYYLMEDTPLFAFGGAEGSMASGLPSLEIRAGVGYGRFTDVTPLAKAMTIQTELLDLDALSAKLPDDVLMSIAEVIGREIEYETIKAWVADIEALIEASAGVDLDARALLTIEEVLLTSGDDRMCGWAVQAGIGYEVIDPLGAVRDIVLAASADAAFAAGPTDQWLFHASFSGPFDILEENTLSATLGYELELEEDSILLADYALQRVQSGDDVSVSHAATLSLTFDVGGADVGASLSLVKDASVDAWSIDLSLSAAMDLL